MGKLFFSGAGLALDCPHAKSCLNLMGDFVRLPAQKYISLVAFLGGCLRAKMIDWVLWWLMSSLLWIWGAPSLNRLTSTCVPEQTRQVVRHIGADALSAGVKPMPHSLSLFWLNNKFLAEKQSHYHHPAYLTGMLAVSCVCLCIGMIKVCGISDRLFSAESAACRNQIGRVYFTPSHLCRKQLWKSDQLCESYMKLNTCSFNILDGW